MNFRGLKKKLFHFKRIFTAAWSTFVEGNPRYDTDYYHSEIQKMLTCGSEANGFATYQCLGCGKGEHKVNFSCKGKACPQCGKRYARDSMVKIAARLFRGVRHCRFVLTLPEQLRIPFYNHPNQGNLYSRFMDLAEPCLTELIQDQLKNPITKIPLLSFSTPVAVMGVTSRTCRSYWQKAAFFQVLILSDRFNFTREEELTPHRLKCY